MYDYSKRKGVATSSLRFLLDGRRFRGDQTPADIDAQDGDQIDVVREQIGDIGVWGDHAGAVGTPLLLAGCGSTEESRSVMAALGAGSDAFESHSGARVLDAAECAALRELADGARRDEHDFKLDLTRAQLAACIGAKAVERLVARCGDAFDAIKVRRVEPSGKVINFHMDVSRRTVQIPLVGDDAYVGGRLVYCTRDGLAIPERPAGSFTVHTNAVAHGVTQHTAGVRYALFLLRTQGPLPALA